MNKKEREPNSDGREGIGRPEANKGAGPRCVYNKIIYNIRERYNFILSF